MSGGVAGSRDDHRPGAAATPFTPLLLRVHAGAFAAGFEHARGRDVIVELEGWTDTAGCFLARCR